MGNLSEAKTKVSKCSSILVSFILSLRKGFSSGKYISAAPVEEESSSEEDSDSDEEVSKADAVKAAVKAAPAAEEESSSGKSALQKDWKKKIADYVRSFGYVGV